MSYSGKFKDKNNNLHPVTSVLYGTCDTAAATAAKVVTCSDFDALMTGVTIRVKFANANTAASPTVNINSTGAKSVYRFGSTAPVDGNSWNAGEVVELVYDGTSFFMTGADDLSVKQNVTDNSLQTTDKTIVGAINEHEGDVSTLKSGFTNLDNEVNGDATTYPYADVITIPDAVPANLADCKVKIEPVQDLHGQSAPYVGGAGKNKCAQTVDGIKSRNSGFTWVGKQGTAYGITVTILTDDAENVMGYNFNGTCNEGFNFSFDDASYVATESITINGCPDGAPASIEVWRSGNVIGRDSGAGVTVESGSTALAVRVESGTSMSNVVYRPMIRLSTETDATFAPYTNICPISGHTEASVQRDGNDVWAGNDTYTISSDGYVIPNTTISLPIGTYAFEYDCSNPNGLMQFEVFKNNSQQSKNCIYNSYGFNASTHNMVKFTINEAGTNLRLYTNNSSGVTISNVRLYSTTQTYTIALGDTIYGGTVDFDSGVMTVDRAIVDLGDLTWLHEGADSGFWANDLSPVRKLLSTDAICSAYEVYDQEIDLIANAPVGKVSFQTNNNARVIIRDTSYNDVSTFTTAVTGQKLCYELATPTTIQLTPQQIQLLKGQNTLTASTGQISVTVNGVSGAIGSVQEQVNDIETRLGNIESEINSYETITSITADGVKTFSELFSELYSYITDKCAIVYNGLIFNKTREATGAVSFGTSTVLDGIVYIANMTIYSNRTEYVEVEITSNGVTFADKGSVVVPSGRTVQLVK